MGYLNAEFRWGCVLPNRGLIAQSGPCDSSPVNSDDGGAGSGHRVSRPEMPTADKPLVIGVAGGTGSGKTTIARKLAASMPAGRCVLIEHDAYYRDQRHLSATERASINYDHPSSLESSLLAEHLQKLRTGIAVDVPVYDYVSNSISNCSSIPMPTFA